MDEGGFFINGMPRIMHSQGNEVYVCPVLHSGDFSMSDLTIRPAKFADLPALTELYNYYVRTSAATFDTVPFSVTRRQHWFLHYQDIGPYRLLVAVQDDSVVGYATSSRFREKAAYATSVETSVYVQHNVHGQGIGTKLYTRLFEVLANEDVHRAYAGIALPNPASIALHTRFGFSDIGVYHEVGRKFDRYWSVQWLEKPLS